MQYNNRFNYVYFYINMPNKSFIDRNRVTKT